MKKIRVSAVSYINTKPFIFGLSKSSVMSQIDLSLDIPSDCASKLIEDRVDVGLIPVAALPDVNNAQIIGTFCIGSVGAVNSVFIFSHCPIEQVKTLKLDNQSRTSNNLAKVLLKNHFKKQVEFTYDDVQTDAIVLIGDRTFLQRKNFQYAYDLGAEWMNFSGLPFLYAAWVANKELPELFIKEFDNALNFGVNNIDEVVKTIEPIEGINLKEYLSKQLDFNLDERKLQAKDLFLKLILEL